MCVCAYVCSCTYTNTQVHTHTVTEKSIVNLVYLILLSVLSNISSFYTFDQIILLLLIYILFLLFFIIIYINVLVMATFSNYFITRTRHSRQELHSITVHEAGHNGRVSNDNQLQRLAFTIECK